MNSVLQPVVISLFEAVLILGGFILCGLILGVLESETDRNLLHSFGQPGVILISLLGTPVHEIGHAMMAFIFGHKIVKMKLLQFNSPDGTLGYVNHSYNPRNFYQRVGNFFIALGPLFSGTGVLFAVMYFLLPNTFVLIAKSVVKTQYCKFSIQKFTAYFFGNFKTVFLSIFTPANIHNSHFWVFIIIAICISSHIALSSKDLEGMADGLVMAFIAIFAMNLLIYIFGSSGILGIMFNIKYGVFSILYLLSVSIMFSVIAWLISFILSIFL